MKTSFFAETLSKFFNPSKPIVYVDKGEDGKESMSTVPYEEAVSMLTFMFEEFLLHGEFLGRDPIEDFFPVLKIWEKKEDRITEYEYSSTTFGNWKGKKIYHDTMTEITGRSIGEKVS